MNVANHAAAGSIIALSIRQPVLALPLAFASHFLLDALPHFGYNQKGFAEALKHRVTYAELALSVAAAFLLVYLLRNQGPIVFAAAFLAAVPDIIWVYRYYGFEKKGLEPPAGPLTRFHKKIQWYERPWGIVLEAAAFILMYVTLVGLIR